ncbi:MAG: hypothetical protein K2K41_05280, partial [Ruminiclostridium sp.]|nr:hypothetical protein [Ruminiclostridium sp.]
FYIIPKSKTKFPKVLQQKRKLKNKIFQMQSENKKQITVKSLYNMINTTDNKNKAQKFLQVSKIKLAFCAAMCYTIRRKKKPAKRKYHKKKNPKI